MKLNEILEPWCKEMTPEIGEQIKALFLEAVGEDLPPDVIQTVNGREDLSDPVNYYKVELRERIAGL